MCSLSACSSPGTVNAAVQGIVKFAGGMHQSREGERGTGWSTGQANGHVRGWMGVPKPRCSRDWVPELVRRQLPVTIAALFGGGQRSRRGRWEVGGSVWSRRQPVGFWVVTATGQSPPPPKPRAQISAFWPRGLRTPHRSIVDPPAGSTRCHPSISCMHLSQRHDC